MRGAALAAAGRIRQAWPILVDALALPHDRAAHAVDATPERLAYLDRQAIADREARHLALRDRRAATGPIRAPVRPGLLDARAAVDQAVTAAAGEMHRATTGAAVRARAASTDDRVTLALDVISVSVRSGLPAGLLAVWVGPLEQAAATAFGAAGLDAFRAKVAAVSCPACELRSVWIEQCSPLVDEWVALCDYSRCVCAGPACPCGCVDRSAGRRHVWARDEWSILSAINLTSP